MKEYNDAEKILVALITENKVDKDAYFELFKLKFNNLEKKVLDDRISRNSPMWKSIEEVLELYNRVEKLDEEGSFSNELEMFSKTIKKYEGMVRSLEDDEASLTNARTLLQKILKADFKYSDNFEKAQDAMFKLVNDTFKFSHNMISVVTCKENNASDTDYYAFSGVKDLGRDGNVVLTYNKTTKNSQYNPHSVERSYKSNVQSIDKKLMSELVDYCFEGYKEYNKTEEKKAKKKHLLNKIYAVAFLTICLLLILFPLILFINNQAFYAILFIILIDSWSIPMLIKKEKQLIFDIKWFNNFMKKSHI